MDPVDWMPRPSVPQSLQVFVCTSWLTRSCRSGWTPYSVLLTRGCCNLARRRRLIRCERGRTKSSNVGHLERRTVVASDQMRLMMMMMQPTDWWLPDRSTYLRSVAAGAALQRRRQRQQQPAHTCERLGPRDPLLAEQSERASERAGAMAVTEVIFGVGRPGGRQAGERGGERERPRSTTYPFPWKFAGSSYCVTRAACRTPACLNAVGSLSSPVKNTINLAITVRRSVGPSVRPSVSFSFLAAYSACSGTFWPSLV